jgi:hypothetical protein
MNQCNSCYAETPERGVAEGGGIKEEMEEEAKSKLPMTNRASA